VEFLVSDRLRRTRHRFIEVDGLKIFYHAHVIFFTFGRFRPSGEVSARVDIRGYCRWGPHRGTRGELAPGGQITATLGTWGPASPVRAGRARGAPGGRRAAACAVGG
jgi:hypothetical protein